METSVNNKCKSFTSLEQSKKLAEILPLESADMYWLYVTSQGKHIAMMYEEPDPHYLARMKSYGIKDAAIPCWTLAAMLDALPSNLQLALAINDYQGDIKERYAIGSVNSDIYDCYAGNPVDACYELILKLNELKLL